MTSVQPVYVIGAARTPTGKKGGGISQVHPVNLGIVALKECVKRAGITPEQVENVQLGCATQTAEQGLNIARQVTREAFGFQVPASTINMLCGSGAEAINNIWGQIVSEQIEIGVAGGVENNLKVFQGQDLMPFSQSLSGSINNILLGIKLGPRIVKLTLPESFILHPMGKSGDAIAEEWNISRESLDRYAAESQWRSSLAMASGKFDEEIVPVETPYGVIKSDEGIRPDTTLEGLAKLPPRFENKTGFHTAGNSSQISAGAAALVLASEKAVKENNLKPLAKLVATARVGTDSQDPGEQLIGLPEAIRKVLIKAGLKLNDIDLFEINEAFAAVVIATMVDLGLERNKINVNGGAIALGHPLGVSGARLPITLIYEMKRMAASGQKCKLGLSALCIGGGQAIATIFERVVPM